MPAVVPAVDGRTMVRDMSVNTRAYAIAMVRVTRHIRTPVWRDIMVLRLMGRLAVRRAQILALRPRHQHLLHRAMCRLEPWVSIPRVPMCTHQIAITGN